MVTNVGGGRSSFRSVVISISGFGGRHLDNVRSDTVKSSMVDNMGIALQIAAPSLAVEKLFPHPASLAAILNLGSLPSSINVGLRLLTSGCVLSVKSNSGVVETVGSTAFGIPTHSTTVKKLFPVPVWCPPS